MIFGNANFYIILLIISQRKKSSKRNINMIEYIQSANDGLHILLNINKN